MTGERILVVDDGADIRHTIIHYILKPNAYDYLEAKDGLEALEILRTQIPDLILLDLQMPRLDGVEFLRRLHGLNISVPVILMTMYGSEEIAIEVFRLGARNYIIKPFSEEELLGAIEQALNETRLRQERDDLTRQLMAANEDLARQVEQLKMVVEASREIVTAPDSATLISHTLEAVARIVNPQSAALLLVGEDQRSLICVGRVTASGRVELLDVPVENALAWEVIRANEPRVGGAEYDESIEGFTVPLAVPMYAGETAGALIITVEAEPLSEHEVTLLSALAISAATGLEQLRLAGRPGGR